VPLELRTTLLLRGVAPEASSADLLRLLDGGPFRGCYNFIYIPFDFRRLASVGYAVVNMVTSASATVALEQLDGAMLRGRALRPEWSRSVQGLFALVEKYRNSSVMHPEIEARYKPLLFAGTEQLPFPAPSHPLQHPLSLNRPRRSSYDFRFHKTSLVEYDRTRQNFH